MARVRQQGPQAVHPTARLIPPAPVFYPLFNDTIGFANHVLAPIGNLSHISQQHHNIHTRELLVHDFLEIRSRLSNILAEVGNLSRVNYAHLQAIFENPHYDALAYLQNLVKTIGIIAAQLSRILETNLHDPNARELSSTYQQSAAGLEHRITQALRSWQEYRHGQHSHSSLCATSLKLIEGSDEGVINYIDARNLDREERTRLEHKGGSIQYWKCEECKFETPFYVRKARNATIERTEDTIPFKDADANIKYRSVLLAKSHVRRSLRPVTFACLLCLARGGRVPDAECSFKTEKGLLKHIGSRHTSADLPRVFMDKLRICNTGTHKDGERYDVKFSTE